MEEKDFILRFHARVREIDRKYEKHNNQDFDNGVYHKFAYKQHKPAGSVEEAQVDDGPKERTSSLKKISNPSLANEGLPNFYRKMDNAKIDQVVELGYPRDLVIKSLKQNLSNHCTTCYYLLCMDQDFTWA